MEAALIYQLQVLLGAHREREGREREGREGKRSWEIAWGTMG
jgi:hypothetical protein